MATKGPNDPVTEDGENGGLTEADIFRIYAQPEKETVTTIAPDEDEDDE